LLLVVAVVAVNEAAVVAQEDSVLARGW